MFNNIYFYVLPSVFIQLALVFCFFNIPNSMLSSFLFLPVIITLITVFFGILIQKKIDITKAVEIKKWTIDYKILEFFCWFIVFLVPFDIYFNGFKILNPATYAEFHGIGRYIRYVTNFSWLICLFSAINFKRNISFKVLLIISVLIPIIFIDRNRLLMCFFNMFIVWYFISKGTKKSKNIKVLLCFLGVLGIFSLIGLARSGTAFYVPSSGTKFISGYYPLKQYFYLLPVTVQQVVLYITTPLFNFSHMLDIGFKSDVFLLRQVDFLNRDLYPVYPYSPILIPRYNVGTEFFPILLCFGKIGVFLAVLIILSYFSFFFYLLYLRPNFYTLSFFMKISYVILLMGFAPQFFIVYNIASLFLMLFAYLFIYVVVRFYNKQPHKC
jgi:hypothetical protein